MAGSEIMQDEGFAPVEQGAAFNPEPGYEASSSASSSSRDPAMPEISVEKMADDIIITPKDFSNADVQNLHKKIQQLKEDNFLLVTKNIRYKNSTAAPTLMREFHANSLVLHFIFPTYNENNHTEKFNQAINVFLSALSAKAGTSNNNYFGLGILLLNLLLQDSVEYLMVPSSNGEYSGLFLDALFKLLEQPEIDITNINFLNSLLTLIYKTSSDEVKHCILGTSPENHKLPEEPPENLWVNFKGFSTIENLHTIGEAKFLSKPIKMLLLSLTQTVATRISGIFVDVLDPYGWASTINTMSRKLIINPSKKTCTLHVDPPTNKEEPYQYTFLMNSYLITKAVREKKPIKVNEGLDTKYFSLAMQATLKLEDDNVAVNEDTQGFILDHIQLHGTLANCGKKLLLENIPSEMQNGIAEALNISLEIIDEDKNCYNFKAPQRKPYNKLENTTVAKVADNNIQPQEQLPEIQSQVKSLSIARKVGMVIYAALGATLLITTAAIAALVFAVALTNVLTFLIAGTGALLFGAVIVDSFAVLAERSNLKVESKKIEDGLDNTDVSIKPNTDIVELSKSHEHNLAFVDGIKSTPEKQSRSSSVFSCLFGCGFKANRTPIHKRAEEAHQKLGL